MRRRSASRTSTTRPTGSRWWRGRTAPSPSPTAAPVPCRGTRRAEHLLAVRVLVAQRLDAVVVGDDALVLALDQRADVGGQAFLFQCLAVAALGVVLAALAFVQ